MAATEVKVPGLVAWEAINGVVYVQGTSEVIPYSVVSDSRDRAVWNEETAKAAAEKAQAIADEATTQRESWDNLLASATP